MSAVTVVDVRIAFGYMLSAALEAGVITHSTEFDLEEGGSGRNYRIKRRTADDELVDAFDGLTDGRLGTTAKEAQLALRMLRLGMEAAFAARPAAPPTGTSRTSGGPE